MLLAPIHVTLSRKEYDAAVSAPELFLQVGIQLEDFGGGTLDAYADKEKEIAEDYGLGVIDVFYEIGFCEENIMDFTEDGMHLDNTGRQFYARFLAEKMGELSERDNK